MHTYHSTPNPYQMKVNRTLYHRHYAYLTHTRQMKSEGTASSSFTVNDASISGIQPITNKARNGNK